MNYGEQTLKLLKDEVTEIEYKRYIKNLIFMPTHSSETHLIFQAPNILTLTWIQSKYKETFQAMAELITGLTTSVEFIVGDVESVQKIKVAQRAKNPIDHTNLNPTHTFDNYVVGESNQFVYTVCRAIVEKESLSYNPLFIHGDSGLGKTHLVQAIGNALKNSKEVLYIAFETFLNEFTKSLKYNSMENFREKFRQCDILIIDDIQFIRNKERTQDELFFTFDELDAQGKQIIFTSDVHPKKIEGLENRLKDRFQMGLIAKVDPLDLDIKIKIIKKIAEINAIDLDECVVNYIASHTDNSAREIKGILNKIHMYHILLQEEITLNLAKKALEDTDEAGEVSLDDIVLIVAKDLNMKKSEICSKTRKRDVVKARRIATYISKRLTGHSLKEIALHFSYGDHSAVSHALKKFTNEINVDAYLNTQVENLINKISKSVS